MYQKIIGKKIFIAVGHGGRDPGAVKDNIVAVSYTHLLVLCLLFYLQLFLLVHVFLHNPLQFYT